jgi:hypothetical protein
MQVVLFYAHRNMGGHVRTQKKICLATLLVLAGIFLAKLAYILMTGDDLSQILPQKEQELLNYGFNFKTGDDGQQTWNKISSFEFETLAMIICLFLI